LSGAFFLSGRVCQQRLQVYLPVCPQVLRYLNPFVPPGGEGESSTPAAALQQQQQQQLWCSSHRKGPAAGEGAVQGPGECCRPGAGGHCSFPLPGVCVCAGKHTHKHAINHSVFPPFSRHPSPVCTPPSGQALPSSWGDSSPKGVTPTHHVPKVAVKPGLVVGDSCIEHTPQGLLLGCPAAAQLCVLGGAYRWAAQHSTAQAGWSQLSWPPAAAAAAPSGILQGAA